MIREIRCKSLNHWLPVLESKIGTWYNTVEETLFNLGLPPNRAGGQKGFLVYDTEGRVPKAAVSTDGPKMIL